MGVTVANSVEIGLPVRGKKMYENRKNLLSSRGAP